MVLFEISIDFTRVYTSFRVLRFQCLGLCVGVSEEKDPTIDAKTAALYFQDPNQGTSMFNLIHCKSLCNFMQLRTETFECPHGSRTVRV